MKKELGCHFQCKSWSAPVLMIGQLQRGGHQAQARAVGSPVEAVQVHIHSCTPVRTPMQQPYHSLFLPNEIELFSSQVKKFSPFPQMRRHAVATVGRGSAEPASLGTSIQMASCHISGTQFFPASVLSLTE